MKWQAKLFDFYLPTLSISFKQNIRFKNI